MRAVTMEARYGIKHLIRMGEYESLTIEASLLFDVNEGETVESVYAVARDNIDRALGPDLKRAEELTAFDSNGTYIHDWVEEVY
jgi:hypothetical protein